MIKALSATLAIVLMLFSRGTYLASVLRGGTRPHAFSWLIAGVVSTITVAAQISEHAGPAAWVRGIGCVTAFLILTLCSWKGERDIRRLDWLALFVSLLAIPLWVATATPLWSVMLVSQIEIAAYIPTVRKVWNKPGEETPYSYLLSGLSAFLALLAIEHYTPATWLSPAVQTFSNSAMAACIFARRHIMGSAVEHCARIATPNAVAHSSCE